MRAFSLLGATLAAVFLGLLSAHALTASDISQVAAATTNGARLPLDVTVRTLSGSAVPLRTLIDRPTVLLFADYTCRTLCSPVIAFAGRALDDSGLEETGDYRLVVVGIDPKDSLDAARAMRDAQLGPSSTAVFLLPDATQVAMLTEALGYRYAYDAANDQFAHAAAAYFLDHSGKVVRVLSGLALDPADFRLALVEAGRGAIGTITDQVHLLCYGFDPARGAYNLSVSRLLSVTAAISVAGLGGLIGVLIVSGRRRSRV